MDHQPMDVDQDRNRSPTVEGENGDRNGDQAQGQHARMRKRTRRACDKCSSSRTRCDGECPCRRCEGMITSILTMSISSPFEACRYHFSVPRVRQGLEYKH
ncbi:hypothetical protein GE09DRAFT_206821 [Coniochaeta sp. 2T2.1]|nr:hypothetical protein GE09DRAFT_206821 [Coniochaeta sp. 2T2.1]